MNLLHLQYFYSVARDGGFTKASQSLGIRQPAISKMVAQLELELGIKLFERQGRSVILTQKGKEVFEYSRRIFSEIDELKGSLGEIRGECLGDLKFAAADPIASFLVPKALKSYLEDFPLVYPQYISGPAPFLLDGIKKGELEFGLFFHISNLKNGLAITNKIKVRFRLVVRSDLKNNSKVTSKFIGSREIDDTTTRKFPTLERWKEKNRKAKITISTNHITSHIHLVEEGMGIAVLPEFLIVDKLKQKQFVDLLPQEKLIFNLKVIARETAVLSLNAKTFIERIQTLT